MPLFEIELCSVLQCVAVCCSVLQCVAVCCSVLQRVAACCSLLHIQLIICSDEITQQAYQWLSMNCVYIYIYISNKNHSLHEYEMYTQTFVRMLCNNEHTSGWVWSVYTHICISSTKIILYTNTKCILNHLWEWFVTTSIPVVEYEFCIHIYIYLQQKSFSTWIQNTDSTICENNLWRWFVATRIPIVQYEFYWEWPLLEKTMADILSQPNSNSPSQTAKVICNKSHSQLNDREWLLLLEMNLADIL